MGGMLESSNHDWSRKVYMGYLFVISTDTRLGDAKANSQAAAVKQIKGSIFPHMIHSKLNAIQCCERKKSPIINTFKK